MHYNRINPISFLRPISPNIAAQYSNIPIKVDMIETKIQFALNYPADVCVIEGIGGWMTPLNNTETMADLVKNLCIPVILVVGIKLGCLNHALLTIQAIKSAKVSLIGWMANCIELNTQAIPDIILTLESFIQAPCLGIIPYNNLPEHHIDVRALMNYFSQ
jgi:dethiobiotin synthetase